VGEVKVFEAFLGCDTLCCTL